MIRPLLLASTVALALTACSAPETKAPEAEAPAAPVQEGTGFVPGAAVTPAEVSALIAASAPDTLTALGAFTDQPSRWTTMLNGVALGQAEWLAIVPSLEPLTENSTSYDLNAALQQALINNAAGTLALIRGDDDLRAEAICSVEDFGGPSPQIAAFYDAATPAVEAVSDPVLGANKAACLTYLKARAGA